MGHKPHFYIRGIITFKLSPFEQKAFYGFIQQDIINNVLMVIKKSPFWLPRK